MRVQLIKYGQENNRVDKDTYFGRRVNYDCVIRDSTSIFNPTIQISTDVSIIEYTYCYIEDFKRYYFITNIVAIRNGLWSLSLSEDVLMSFKEDILNQTCIVARNEYQYNLLLQDDKLFTKYERKITESEVTNIADSSITYTEFLSTASRSSNSLNCIITGIGKFWSNTNIETPIVNINSHNFLPNISVTQQILFGTSINNINSVAIDIAYLEALLVWLQDRGRSSYIVSIIILPYFVPVVTQSGYNLGNIQINGEDSGIKCYGMTYSMSNYITTNKFTINSSTPISFLDYEPYTNYSLYLPYCDYIELKASQVLNKTLMVQYQVNYLDGSAQCIVTNATDNQIISTQSCQLGIRIPISSDNAYDISLLKTQNITNGVLSGLTSIVGMYIGGLGIANGLSSVSGGSALNNLGLITAGTEQVNYNTEKIGSTGIGLIGTIANTIMNDQKLYPTAKCTSGGGQLSYYLPQKVRLRKSFIQPSLSPTNTLYCKLYGKPLETTTRLSNMHGFTIVAEIELENFFNATAQERNAVISSLKNGVHFPEP